MTSETRERILALAHDLPQVWNAPSTTSKDRKEMLRLVIKDITVERTECDTGKRQALLHIRWQGGLCEDLAVDIPPPVHERVRYKNDVIGKVRELARDHEDADIAHALNAAGLLSAKGMPFNVSMVKWIRYKHNIPIAELRRPEELTVRETAEKLGVSTGVVYYWLQRGIVTSRKTNNGSRCWLSIDTAKETELKERIRQSSRLPKQEAVC